MPTVHPLHRANCITEIWISRRAFDDLERGRPSLRKTIRRIAEEGEQSWRGRLDSKGGGVFVIGDGSTLRLMGFFRGNRFLITRSSTSKAGGGHGSRQESKAIEDCKEDNQKNRYDWAIEPL